MKWITRERPKIDRIACPWLIARFIDKEPEFLFVPTADVMAVAKDTGATPFDVHGVEYTHVGADCSFDTFIKKHKLQHPGLQDLATIVRGADTDRLDLAPQAAGLLAISLGLSHNFSNDHEMLAHGMVCMTRCIRGVATGAGSSTTGRMRLDIFGSTHWTKILLEIAL